MQILIIIFWQIFLISVYVSVFHFVCKFRMFKIDEKLLMQTVNSGGCSSFSHNASSFDLAAEAAEPSG